jgi:hypothetical protein
MRDYRWTALMAALLAATAAHGSVRISSKPTKNMNCIGGLCTATARKAILNADDLAAMLTGGDVTVASGSMASDIEIDHALSWGSPHRLTLDAYRSIAFYNRLDVLGAGSALTITTNDGGTNGDFHFLGKGQVRIYDLMDSLVINGATYALVNTVKQLARKEAAGAANVALAQDYNFRNHTSSAPPIASAGGVIEGLGHTIARFKINSASGPAALIGTQNSASTIRDLRLHSVSITASGSRQEIGALVGHADGTVDGCFADGQVTSLQSGQTSSNIGGLVGTSDGLVVNSGAAVSVSSQGVDVAGGLVGVLTGSAPGTVEYGYATGAVSATAAQATVGGLVGANLGGFVISSYARGAVTGGDQAVAGGLIGFNTQNADLQAQVVDESYSTGKVTGGSDAFVGGVIGVDASGFNNFDNYWDLDTSGVSDPSQGAGSPQDDLGLTGLTTAQFLAKLPSGFAKTTWRQGGAINDGYPYLLGNPPQ